MKNKKILSNIFYDLAPTDLCCPQAKGFIITYVVVSSFNVNWY